MVIAVKLQRDLEPKLRCINTCIFDTQIEDSTLNE